MGQWFYIIFVDWKIQTVLVSMENILVGTKDNWLQTYLGAKGKTSDFDILYEL